MGCDKRTRSRRPITEQVSIPVRVWGGLRFDLLAANAQWQAYRSFNPCKGLGWVAILLQGDEPLPGLVSIPVRVWGGLRYKRS